MGLSNLEASCRNSRSISKQKIWRLREDLLIYYQRRENVRETNSR